ncbi:MAG: energy transducer TonB [Janthinobacterium lividum]
MKVRWNTIFSVVLAGGHLLSLGQQVDVPARISSGVMANMLVTKVMPAFPQDALQAKVNGAVVMHVVIGIDGHVETASVVSGPEMLRSSYLAAVRQWVYVPFVLNGKKVRVDTTVTLSLNMGADAPFQPVPAGALGNGDGAKGAEEQPRRVRISSGVMAGQVLRIVQPVYPTYTREDHVIGATILHVVIGREGKVKEVSIISGPEARRRVELEAVKQWEYKPYLLNGEPVEVDTTVVLQPSFGG